MEDLERYGDYNDTDDDIPRRKSPVGLVLKILVGVICISVAGILAFRLMLFNSYPDSIENIYFNDALTAFYNENNGDIGAKTQDLRSPYDNPDEGNFFCDNLILIPGIDQLQVSVRFNLSLIENLEKKYGVKLDAESENFLEFALVKNPIDENSEPREIGSLAYEYTDSKYMYKYYKLVFDGVDLGIDEGEESVKWIRLEIQVNGIESDEPFMVLVYENNDVYSQLDDYKLSNKEKPGK